MQPKLSHDHSPQAIQERIAGDKEQSYVGDFLLGAIDGLVTTFALVAGVAGAGLEKSVAIILGLANLFADGFSMAASNYQKVKSDAEFVDKARRIEEQHIDVVPEGEMEEIRQIYKSKGFDGKILEEIVAVITSNRKNWVDTMLTEELGLRLDVPRPMTASLVTFWSFVLIGLIPLIPFFVPQVFTQTQTFGLSAIATATTFYIIGSIKGKILHQKQIASGLETLIIGGLAATIAFFVGIILRHLL